MEDDDEREMNEKSFQVFVRVRPLIHPKQLTLGNKLSQKPISIEVEDNTVP